MSLLARSLTARAERTVASPHPWGHIEVTAPVRYGWRAFRLTVYPPGTTIEERRLLWLDRYSPWLVTTIALAGALMLAGKVPPLALFLVIPAGAAVIALLRRRTRALRAKTHSASVAYISLGGRNRMLGDGPIVDDAHAALCELDRKLAAREISAVEYELGWSEVYEQVGAVSNSRAPQDDV